MTNESIHHKIDTDTAVFLSPAQSLQKIDKNKLKEALDDDSYNLIVSLIDETILPGGIIVVLRRTVSRSQLGIMTDLTHRLIKVNDKLNQEIQTFKDKGK